MLGAAGFPALLVFFPALLVFLMPGVAAYPALPVFQRGWFLFRDVLCLALPAFLGLALPAFP